HTDPDYSCAYVILTTNDKIEGNGFTFTLGRGTEIVTCAIKSMSKMVIGVKVKDIFDDFSTFWHKLTNDTQMRWVHVYIRLR
uniref:Uncharacterized protein n=1 Tax=Strigamia maritima TaxID=126957 RepID=T1IW35_STRMM